MENSPGYILNAAKNFSVEIDVWYIDNKYFLGHDKPQYEVDKFFLFKERFLIHAKSMETFFELSKYSQIETFFQSQDDISMTTKNRIVIHGRNETIIDDHRSNIWVDLDGMTRIHELGVKNNLLTDYPLNYNEISHSQNRIFDLLILDIDGVLTNGRKIYNNEGSVTGKEFNDKDFTAIKRFLAQGIKVVFLSGDKSVNESMSKIRGIDFFYAKNIAGDIDKSEFIPDLKINYEAEIVAYVGDDYYDLTIIDKVDLSFCPSDATIDVKLAVNRVLKTAGGEGVVAELFDYAMAMVPKVYANDYLNGKE
jgi:3-deoxy-D-manno-octulosonate 8-phosphate phosphatase (KDO 8-P phosphatase)